MDIILVVVPATKQEVLCLPWYLFAYWQSANNVDNYIILINLFGILYQTIAAFCVWCSFLCQFPRTRIPSSLRWRDREAGLPEAVTDAAPSHAMVLAPSQTGLQSYLFAFFFLLIIAINLIILKSSRKSACQLLSLGGSTWWKTALLENFCVGQLCGVCGSVVWSVWVQMCEDVDFLFVFWERWLTWYPPIMFLPGCCYLDVVTWTPSCSFTVGSSSCPWSSLMYNTILLLLNIYLYRYTYFFVSLFFFISSSWCSTLHVFSVL